MKVVDAVRFTERFLVEQADLQAIDSPRNICGWHPTEMPPK